MRCHQSSDVKQNITSLKMRRIAIVLVGHYRSFDQTLERLMCETSGLNIDWYLHTWNTSDAITLSWHHALPSDKLLTASQKMTLEALDPDYEIGSQSFTQAELEDAVFRKPWKAVNYLFTAVQKCLQRVKESGVEYDYILVSRYDVQLNNMGLLTLQVPLNHIVVGGRATQGFYNLNIAASDVIFALNPANIDAFIEEKEFLRNKANYHSSEEPYSQLYVDKFAKVVHQWHYDNHFTIIR